MSSLEASNHLVLSSFFRRRPRPYPRSSLTEYHRKVKRFRYDRQPFCDVGNPLTKVPSVITFHIFDQLTITELSQISVTSKSLRKLVIDYCVQPKSGPLRLIPGKIASRKGVNFLWPTSKEAKDKHTQLFEQLGVLIKRVTCILPTGERLKIAFDFLEKLTNSLPDYNKMKEENNNQRFILDCYGNFCDRMFRGWDENECKKVFDFLERKFKIDSIISLIFSSRMGVHSSCEYFIRCYYRLMCLDHLEIATEQMCWLSLILEKHSKVTSNVDINKAKLLATLYAPIVTDDEEDDRDENREDQDHANGGAVINGDLRDYQENGIGGGEPRVARIAWSSLSTQFYLEELGQLGRRIFWLHRKEPLWNDDQIILLIRNLTSIPDTWALENVAALLHHCGEGIVKLCLRNYYLQCELNDAAMLIVYLTYITFKKRRHSEWILDIIDEFWSSDAPIEIRSKLITEIPHAFDMAFSEISHLVEYDWLEVDELQDFMSAATSFMASLLRKTYQVIEQSSSHVTVCSETTGPPESLRFFNKHHGEEAEE